MRHFALEEIVSGIVKWPRLILVKRTLGSVSWNGYRPTSIVYNITPRLQTSAAFPEYPPLACKISGLTYAGQPCLSSSVSSGPSRGKASSRPSSFTLVLEENRERYWMWAKLAAHFLQMISYKLINRVSKACLKETALLNKIAATLQNKAKQQEPSQTTGFMRKQRATRAITF